MRTEESSVHASIHGIPVPPLLAPLEGKRSLRVQTHYIFLYNIIFFARYGITLFSSKALHIPIRTRARVVKGGGENCNVPMSHI